MMTLAEPIESIPCFIDPHPRPRVCGVTEEHDADYEVLVACGCSPAYCERAFIILSSFWSSGDPRRVFSCSTHGPTSIITYRPITRGAKDAR